MGRFANKEHDFTSTVKQQEVKSMVLTVTYGR